MTDLDSIARRAEAGATDCEAYTVEQWRETVPHVPQETLAFVKAIRRIPAEERPARRANLLAEYKGGDEGEAEMLERVLFLTFMSDGALDRLLESVE